MPTIPSSPSTFIAHTTGAVTVTFAIPSGTYTAGTWSYAGTKSATISFTPYAQVGANSVSFSTQASGPGSISDTKAASAGQLTSINAAAGGNLSVTFAASPLTTNYWEVDASLFTLALTGVSVDSANAVLAAIVNDEALNGSVGQGLAAIVNDESLE